MCGVASTLQPLPFVYVARLQQDSICTHFYRSLCTENHWERDRLEMTICIDMRGRFYCLPCPSYLNLFEMMNPNCRACTVMDWSHHPVSFSNSGHGSEFPLTPAYVICQSRIIWLGLLSESPSRSYCIKKLPPTGRKATPRNGMTQQGVFGHPVSWFRLWLPSSPGVPAATGTDLGWGQPRSPHHCAEGRDEIWREATDQFPSRLTV